jgi:hypothetical protein
VADILLLPVALVLDNFESKAKLADISFVKRATACNGGIDRSLWRVVVISAPA